jgi:acetolactate synthase-1/2/3 large subunit
MTYPQGPVALEFPIDVQLARTTFSQQSGFIDNAYPEPAPPAADADSVEKAVRILLAAERPVIAGGEAVFFSHAEDELKEFVELTRIPVITRRVGRGAVPEDHPLAFSGRARGAILRAADVAMTVGLNLGYLEGFGAWAAKAKLIQVTESKGDIEFTAKSELVIIASPKSALRQMIDVAKKQLKKTPVNRDAWLKQVDGIKAQEKQRMNDEAEKVKNNKPLHPAWVAQATLAALDKNATIILDAYTASAYFTERFMGQHSGSVLDAGMVAGIGHGVAMAVGAQLARPGQQILSIMGDGGMGLGGMDVESAVRVGTPVVYLVNNNSDYIAGSGPLFNKAISTPGKRYANAPWGIAPTNYAKMFEACGANGIRVEDPDKLTEGVRKAFESGRASVVDVVTDNRVGQPNMTRPPGPQTATGFMSFFDPEDFDEPLRSIIFPPKK